MCMTEGGLIARKKQRGGGGNPTLKSVEGREEESGQRISEPKVGSLNRSQLSCLLALALIRLSLSDSRSPGRALQSTAVECHDRVIVRQL